MAKGHLTFDDYQAAFRRYQACMSQIGYDVQVLELNNQVYDYRLPARTATDVKAVHCYNYEFEQVDEQWQIQKENTSTTADSLRNCLKAHGLPATGTVGQMAQQLESHNVDPLSCP